MPNITVDGPPGPDLAKRREFVRELTDAAVAYYGRFKPEDIVVLIREHPAECVAVGGQLVCDRRPKE